MKEKQVFGKKLATSPNREKPANKHTKPKQKKNIPLKTTQNMPRCNALQRWNSNLELGEEPKTSKRRRNSYLKEKCIFQGKDFYKWHTFNDFMHKISKDKHELKCKKEVVHLHEKYVPKMKEKMLFVWNFLQKWWELFKSPKFEWWRAANKEIVMQDPKTCPKLAPPCQVSKIACSWAVFVKTSKKHDL